MSVRIFKCQDCGHRMRLSGARCGFCYTDKPFYTRIGFSIIAALVLLIGAFVIALMQLSVLQA